MVAPVPSQHSHLKHYLNQFINQAPVSGWLNADPIQFPKRFARKDQREIVAFFAALLAYGRVGLIARAMENVLLRMGPQLHDDIINDSPDDARRRFDGFVYRLTTGDDLARLWVGLGAVIKTHGSIGTALLTWDDASQTDFRHTLSRLRHAVMTATPGFPDRKGFRHFLADPSGGSAIKRYCMLMRWMVRGPDDVDFGQWSQLGTARLTLPLDTHIHRIARNLGLTNRATPDWKTASEITDRLRALDPVDPTRFDFALAHLGISGSCPSKRVPEICTGCPINKICTLGP